MRPRIGIPLPTSGDFEYNNRCWPEYASAVRLAGGDPVPIPLERVEAVREMVKSCSGFVLPGSPADIEPSRYGHAPERGTAPADEAREECDRAILEHAESTSTPILGICFGLQSANVLRGGTLVQDLRPVPVNHGAGAQVEVAHSVLVAGMTLVGGLLTQTEAPPEGQFRRLPVNSSHHQAVAIPGEGFTVVARSTEDGVVEALEGYIGGAAFVGVQWHPERSYAGSQASSALFAWLVSAAADADDDAAESGGERVRVDAL